MTDVVRMKKRKMFVQVTEAEQKIITNFLIVQYRLNELDCVRTGFTVTKKLGNAVARNRIRRRLKEAVRLYDNMSIMTGYDLVFIGRSATKDCSFEKLKRTVYFALERILELARQKEKND
jgi:ribonuclease P protein component